MSSYSGKVQFGATTFFAQSHSGDSCGSNGLPLTPNSISILGRSQILKSLYHPNLCSYLDIIRGKHERISVVCELHNESLANKMWEGKMWESSAILGLMYEIMQALAFMENRGIVHRALDPANIMFDSRGKASLFNYGLYYMTGGGKFVSFPIGQPRYLAPEVLLAGPRSLEGSSSKVDVWALGMIAAELALGDTPTSPPSAGGGAAQLARSVRRVLSLLKCEGSVLERLARETGTQTALEALPEHLRSLLDKCLTLQPSNRPNPSELLQHLAFNDAVTEPTSDTKHISIIGGSRDYVSERSLSEIYFLWQLAGGDVHAELRKQGLVHSKPPVLSVGNVVLLEGISLGNQRDPATLLDPRIVPLPMEGLYQRLAHVPPESFFPLLETPEIGNWGPSADTSALPLVIRERDTEYQFHRIVLYARLLKGWPHQQARLIREARQDVPPLLRGAVWAALLGVKGDIEGQYAQLDKETPTPTDRQIEVDIPRCHQYDELLSSSVGHLKFKRLLKAWVVGHPQYVYWQGIDSLCAPFLYLNFNNEARAYACLAAFVPKYLQGFFLQDNWAVVQEYLSVFARLTAFHEPILAAHMRSIGFVPELFAIPWFLTMFSHVFPLHKILPLWDRLLLGDSSFPLYVGLGILRQLRDTLLASGFNECILLFSDLPDIDIEKCTKDSVELYCATPHSATYRQYDNHQEQKSTDVKFDVKYSPNLEMSVLSVEELKTEPCPRISGKDMLDLLDPAKEKYSKPRLVIVDIRSTELYANGSFPESINIPYGESDGSLEPDLTMLSNCKGKIITIVSLNTEIACQFAELLMENGFPRVCHLHKAERVLGICSDILVTRIT